MKRIILVFASIAATMALGSCQKEKMVENDADFNGFIASFENSKTSLNGTKVSWEAGDEINVNGYVYKAQEAGASVKFKPVGTAAPSASVYVAAYPASLSVSGTTVTGTVAASQTATAGSVASGTNFAVAKSSDNTLVFKNVLAIAKVKVQSAGVSSVSVTCSNAIQGGFSVNYSGAEPSVSATGDGKTVTLAGTITSGNEYFVTFIPGTTNSLAFDFTMNDGSTWNRTKTGTVSIARNTILNAGRFTWDATSKTGSLENGKEIFVKTTGSATATGDSWDQAKTLDAALASATAGSQIYVAAGTYTAKTKVTGGSASGDVTFEIKNNYEVIGGYPSGATGTDLSGYNPSTNVTTLTGNSTAYHTVTAVAPLENGRKSTLRGFTITGGSCSGSSTVTVAGSKIEASRGGNINVGKTRLCLADCIISNGTGKFGGAMFVGEGAEVSAKHCSFTGNTATSNAACIYNEGGQLTLDACVLKNNTTDGVGGAVYAFGISDTVYPSTSIYNSEISSNKASVGGGIYNREYARTVIVNSTIAKNTATATSDASTYQKGGGAIACYGASGKNTTLHVFSSTITNNLSTWRGGGIMRINEFADMTLYNTIVCGNESRTKTLSIYQSFDILDTEYGTTSPYYNHVSNHAGIISSRVYQDNFPSMRATVFNYGMLSELESHGFTSSQGLVNHAENPAVAYGLTVAELQSYAASVTPAIPAEILAVDQFGVARTGNIMGADVTERILSYPSGVTTELGKKLWAGTRAYFTSFTDGTLTEVADGVKRYTFSCKYRDYLIPDGSAKNRNCYLYEVDLNKAEMFVGLNGDKNTAITAKACTTSLVTGMMTAMAKSRSTYSILGGTNADFYDRDGTKSNLPYGPIHRGGVVVKSTSQRDDYTAVVFKSDNTVDFRSKNGYEGDKEKGFDALGYQEVCCGRSYYLQNGYLHAMVSSSEEEQAPRTTIGASADKTKIWLMVIDGRSTASAGSFYNSMGRMLISLGARNAVNLDGGQSATFAYMNGVKPTVLNKPSSGSEVKVATGLIIAVKK